MRMWKPAVIGMMIGTMFAVGAFAEEGAAGDEAAPKGKRARKERMEREGMAERRAAEFDAMDTDADGEVSLDEFKAFWAERLEKRFAAMDADGDGALVKDEIGKRPERGRGARKGKRWGGGRKHEDKDADTEHVM